MLNLKVENNFKKDVKKAYKQGLQKDEIEVVVNKLLKGEPLEPKYKNHKLKGQYKNFMECHIRPDLLLIYRIEDSNLYLVRLGSHSDLFK